MYFPYFLLVRLCELLSASFLSGGRAALLAVVALVALVAGALAFAFALAAAAADDADDAGA